MCFVLVSLFHFSYISILHRARNSCLQTRKMRVEIQLRSWKYVHSKKVASSIFQLKPNSYLGLIDVQLKCSGNRIKHLKTQTRCHILCDFILFSSAQVSSATHSDVNFLLFINNYTCYLHFQPGLVRLEVVAIKIYLLSIKSIYYIIYYQTRRARGKKDLRLKKISTIYLQKGIFRNQ